MYSCESLPKVSQKFAIRASVDTYHANLAIKRELSHGEDLAYLDEYVSY
jgi:hypothetical protein